MKTKQMIEIMQAYVDGKNTEYKLATEEIWHSMAGIGSPIWNWDLFDYRIKQEWYDNIPEGGISCWVWDFLPEMKRNERVIRYSSNSSFCFATNKSAYVNAEPIKKSDFKFLEDM